MSKESLLWRNANTLIGLATSADTPGTGAPKNKANCPITTQDDPDYSEWACIDGQPGAWQRLGNGEPIPATGDARPDMVARRRCEDCDYHGPW